jgi:hypothetical protein
VGNVDISGRPKSHRTDENVKKLRNSVHSGRRLSIRVMAVQLNLDKETVKISELWPNGCILHYDNAPAQKALSVKQFLPQKKSIIEMEYPPYSSDLAPDDPWLFPQIKSALK